MSDSRQKVLVHSSLETFKCSALNVLYEARDEDLIQQDVIRKHHGIPRVAFGPGKGMPNLQDSYTSAGGWDAFHNAGFG